MKCFSLLCVFLLCSTQYTRASPEPRQSQTESLTVLRPTDLLRVNRYLSVLKDAGIVFPAVGPDAPPLQTRPEFAAAINQWLAQHEQKGWDFDKETDQKLQQHPKAADAFRRLVSEFTPELLRLHVNTFSVKVQFIRFVSAVAPNEYSLPSPIAPKRDPTDFFPSRDGIHQAIKMVTRAGLVLFPLGFPQTYSGPPPSLYTTRSELAAEFTGVLPLLNPVGLTQNQTNRFRAQFQTRLRQNPEEIQALTLIITELKPELDSLGQDVNKTEVCLSVLAQQAALLPSNRPFPDGDPAYVEIHKLIAAGMIKMPPSTDLLKVTRHQWVQTLSPVLENLPKTAFEIAEDEKRRGENYEDYQSAERHKLAMILEQNPPALAAVLAITKELRSESSQGEGVWGPRLAWLPQDAALQAHAAPQRFNNVPVNHWAYASVEALRKAGILVGYPDGTFWLNGP